MKNNYLIKFITVYKLLINILRIITGFLIFYFKGNIDNLIFVLFRERIREDPKDILYHFLSYHITNPSKELALTLASALIVISFIEIFLTIGLFYKNKKSAIGLFIISLFWIPFEILFVSKFLFINKILTIILDIIILLALLKIISKFNKNNDHKMKSSNS